MVPVVLEPSSQLVLGDELLALMVRRGDHCILLSLILQCRIFGGVLLSMSVELEFDLLTLLMLLH